MKQRIFALHCTAADQFSAKIRNDIITFSDSAGSFKKFFNRNSKHHFIILFENSDLKCKNVPTKPFVLKSVQVTV